MVFEKVDPKDPLGPLQVVWCIPMVNYNTGHGKNAERKSSMYRPPRHLPKFGHGRKEVQSLMNVRTDSRRNVRELETDRFVPAFMNVLDSAWVPPTKKVARPHGPTIFERFLLSRKVR